jgi:hypothetical protein
LRKQAKKTISQDTKGARILERHLGFKNKKVHSQIAQAYRRARV